MMVAPFWMIDGTALGFRVLLIFFLFVVAHGGQVLVIDERGITIILNHNNYNKP